MNFLRKNLWLAWSKVRFLMLPRERRVRLEVATDGRHLTYLLTALGEAGYGVHVVGAPFVFRELMCLRKSVPMPFVVGGKERECGISITDKGVWSLLMADSGERMADGGEKKKRRAGSLELGAGFAERSSLGSRRSTLFVLDYDYFLGLIKSGVAHGGTANTDVGEELGKNESSKIFNRTEAAGQPLGRLPQGCARGTWAGASEPSSLTSKLAHAPVSESLTRFASDPAAARTAPEDRKSQIVDMGVGSDGGNQLADSVAFLEGQSQAGLQMGYQKDRTIRAANEPGASEENSSSMTIREIRGQNSSSHATSHSPLATAPQALRMPYFMHPSVYHKGLHKSRERGAGSREQGAWSLEPGALDPRPSPLDSAAKQRRRFRLGFFGTHDQEFYTRHYHFPGMNRFETLEVFLQKFGGRITPLRGFPRDWEPCEIAVSIDSRGGDRHGKSFLSQEMYFEALRECDFVLSPPGWCMPVSHNLIEAMFCGAIPITNGGAFMAEPLADGGNCLEFEDAEGLVSVIESALAMDAGEVERMRRAVMAYYGRFLDPNSFGEALVQSESGRVLVNAEENSVRLVFPGMVFPWDVPAEALGSGE